MNNDVLPEDSNERRKVGNITSRRGSFSLLVCSYSVGFHDCPEQGNKNITQSPFQLNKRTEMIDDMYTYKLICSRLCPIRAHVILTFANSNKTSGPLKTP